ncbi:unnamed protein product, partial [Heterosigma akashiwo]
QRGEPGAARGQLGPPRGPARQGVRPEEPAQHGHLVQGLAQPRCAHDTRRLLRQRAE